MKLIVQNTEVEVRRVADSEISEADVLVAGKRIGCVYRGWFRLGGHGWAASTLPGHGSATRTEAVAQMVVRFLRNQ